MERSKKIRLGIFVAAATLLFITTMYLIGDKQNLFGSTFEIRAVFKDVNGLQRGNNVRLSGIDVGTVRSVEIINDSSVLVILTIETKVQKFIKQNAMVSVGTDGLMGNKLVNINGGSSDAPMVIEGNTLQALDAIDLDQAYKKLANTNSNISLMTDDLVDVVRLIQNGNGTVGRLMSDSTLAKNVQETILNLKESSRRVDRILKSVEMNLSQFRLNEGAIGTLLTDTTLAIDLKNMISKLNITAENTQKISEDLQLVMNDARSGKGIAGQVISDTVLSNKLQQSIENVRLGTEAFNQNMEALKHNILLRRYFKKQEKEKAVDTDK
jgi:phospholipid/cholesterol/gamma-HCH transport system substrate-binding protein